MGSGWAAAKEGLATSLCTLSSSFQGQSPALPSVLGLIAQGLGPGEVQFLVLLQIMSTPWDKECSCHYLQEFLSHN